MRKLTGFLLPAIVLVSAVQAEDVVVSAKCKEAYREIVDSTMSFYNIDEWTEKVSSYLRTQLSAEMRKQMITTNAEYKRLEKERAAVLTQEQNAIEKVKEAQENENYDVVAQVATTIPALKNQVATLANEMAKYDKARRALVPSLDVKALSELASKDGVTVSLRDGNVLDFIIPLKASQIQRHNSSFSWDENVPMVSLRYAFFGVPYTLVILLDKEGSNGAWLSDVFADHLRATEICTPEEAVEIAPKDSSLQTKFNF